MGGGGCKVKGSELVIFTGEDFCCTTDFSDGTHDTCSFVNSQGDDTDSS